MSGNSIATTSEAVEAQKRKGLRVAIAVSIGFTLSVACGSIVPFLGPLFAAQFLLASSRPLPMAKTVGMAIIILAAGAFCMGLTSLLGEKPISFLMILGLAYFICFFIQASGKGGPAIFLILVVGIMVPLLGILNRELANSILSILVIGVLTGAGLMWLAYACVPEPVTVTAQAIPTVVQPNPWLRAFANTVILLFAVAVCLTNDKLAAALVIPITVASLLGQIDSTASMRAATGLAVVNLFGGISASIAFGILNLRPNLLFMFVIVLVVTLFIGGRAASRSAEARMFEGALTIFLVLFGLGVSPLPGSAAESFSTRIIYVAGAISYVFLTTSLLWTRQRQTIIDLEGRHRG